jgi:hypothetical protein
MCFFLKVSYSDENIPETVGIKRVVHDNIKRLINPEGAVINIQPRKSYLACFQNTGELHLPLYHLIRG